jgi:hypothetical protein
MPFERQESWAVPPRPAHGPLGLLFKKFVAFLWQIAPIVPVLPTAPIYKPFAVNKMLAKRYLDTVEVSGSSPLVRIFSIVSVKHFIESETQWPHML